MKEALESPNLPARRVRVLSDSTARKIAAGEVIDRPYAVVRELLDNAIDSQASQVALYLEEGGIKSIRVVDNGRGMSREDLELCWLPHATSKITQAEDLDALSTLGFRGEALSSVAVCSRMDLLSTTPDGQAHQLRVHGGKKISLEPSKGAPGTVAAADNLFYNQPARRRFLKSTRGETTACRRTFLEKAAAHPEVAMRLFIDGVLKLYLPAGDILQRVQSAWPGVIPPKAAELCQGQGEGFSFQIVLARPEMSRSDKRYLQVYANRRRIEEFSFVQAMVRAFDPWMPGGAFPIAFLFLTVEPSLVDFNIHPAKREARFRDPSSLRHRVIEGIKETLTGLAYRQRAEAKEAPPADREAPPASYAKEGNLPYRPPAPAPARGGVIKDRGPTQAERQAWGETAQQIRQERSRAVPPAPQASFRYLGQIMGLFLVAEVEDSLYVVDQHAAHERILFDRFRSAAPQIEKLLIPQPLDLSPQGVKRLEREAEKWGELGIRVESSREGEWSLTALPAAVRGWESEIITFLQERENDKEELEKALWADLSCKAAVKDGEALDDETARELLKEAFSLKTPRCPHGRPLWFEVSRQELFGLVGRTV